MTKPYLGSEQEQDDELTFNPASRFVGALDHSGDFKFLVWNHVRDCRGEKCELYKKCELDKSGKCGVEEDYLEAVMEPFRKAIDVCPDPMVMHQVGLRIISLYHMLLKFQMCEASLDEVLVDAKGMRIVHPIYKEIRQTVQAIRDEFKFSNLSDYIEKLHIFASADIRNQLEGRRLSSIGGGGAPDYERGNPAHYRMLTKVK